MKRASAEEMALLVELSRAIGARSIYPPAHPAVERSVEGVLAAQVACLRAHRTGSVTFLMIEGEVFLDERPLRGETVHLAPFVRTMERAGVQRLTLESGLDADGVRRLLAALAAGGTLPEIGHVDVGRVKLASVGGVSAEELGEGRLDERLIERAERGLEALAAAGGDEGGDALGRLDAVVWEMAEGLAAGRSLLLVDPVAAPGGADRDFRLHAIQVCLLALALGRALGLGGVALQELGMAALLHDVGKLSLPAELRRREGLPDRRLEGADRQRMELHPELGAARLAATPGAPRLAMVVAYEHHLRWDGEPSYPRPRTPRRPGLASQVTAVADTWDADVSRRSPVPGPARAAAVDAWRRRAGSRLDPFLAGAFLRLMGEET